TIDCLKDSSQFHLGNIGNMATKIKIKNNWYTNPIFMLLLITVFFLLGIATIVVLVGNFSSSNLSALTIRNLLQEQENIASDIERNLTEIPSSIGFITDIEQFDDATYTRRIFNQIRKVMKNLQSIRILFLDDSGAVSHISSDFPYKEIPDQAYAYSESKQVVFNDKMIIGLGDPYRDSMDVYTIIPLYLLYYAENKAKVVVFIEVNISQLFYASLAENQNNIPEYFSRIYSDQWLLLETSKNNMMIVEPVLDNAPLLPLDKAERIPLYSTSRYARRTDGYVEIFNRNTIGYVIYGQFPTAYINDSIKPIIFMIVLIGLILIIIFIFIGSLLHRFRNIELNEVIMQIETLQAKLDPHFLFNTLNSMVGLVGEENNTQLIKGFRDLSTFLRSSIDLSTYVSLRFELEFMNSYINIQRLRYGNIFEYNCTVEDEVLLDALIPKFTIQPVVENCFVHAVALIVDDSVIHITIHIRSVDKKNMVIEIKNDGPISEDLTMLRKRINTRRSGAGKDRIGLHLINQELKLIFGKRYGLDLVSANETDGFVVRIILPIKLAQ
ncbi:MAG: sensor histidine kinase, partial [Sphaerochaetaceae bacterium]